MSWELVYTSSPRGLRPNTSGFCTVAVTAGMSRPITQAIERLSAYEFHFGLSDPRANENPTNYLHMLLPMGGRAMHLLSRIAYAGADYSGRTNKIAHHILLSPKELSPAGPADMIRELADAGRFYTTWKGEPRELPPRPLTDGAGPAPAHAGPPAAWRGVTGDAGWAGMLVKGFRENARVPSYLLFEPGLDVLQLYQESLALLPPEARWEVGFSTYYYANLIQADSKVHWRAIVSGSTLARTEVAKYPNAVVLDLTRPLGSPPDNLFVITAREGRAIESAAPAPAQPKGRNKRDAIDISKALNKRQSVQVSKDPLIPADYGTPATQQPLSTLQSAAATRRYPDNSQKTVDSRAKTSRWTWLFATAACLLLLSNVAMLLIVLELKQSPDNLTAQVALLEVEAKTAKDDKTRLNTELTEAATATEAKEKELKSAHSRNKELEDKLAQQKLIVAAASDSNTKGTDPEQARQPPDVKDAPGTTYPKEEPSTRPSPASKPPDASPRDSDTRQVPSKTQVVRVPFERKRRWNGDMDVEEVNLSPSATSEDRYSAKAKNAAVLCDPPGKIAGYFSIQTNNGDEPNAIFYPNDTSGQPDHSRPLATCWLEDTDGVRWLRVELPKGLKDKDKVLRDSLVILLVDKEGKTAFRCPLHKRPPVEVLLKVESDGVKVIYPGGGDGVLFNHPCRKDLSLICNSNENNKRDLKDLPLQKFIGFLSTGTDEVVIKLNHKTEVQVKLLEELAKQLTDQLVKEWFPKLTCDLNAAHMSAPITAEQCVMDPNKKSSAVTREKDKKTESKDALKKKQTKTADDKKWIGEYTKECEALERIKTLVDGKIKKRRQQIGAIDGTVFELRDPSGHVVQKITFKVSWGNKPK